MKVKHSNGSTDSRYTVTREWCGQPTPQHVARFCGEWIDCAPTKRGAWQLVQTHADKRQAKL